MLSGLAGACRDMQRKEAWLSLCERECVCSSESSVLGGVHVVRELASATHIFAACVQPGAPLNKSVCARGRRNATHMLLASRKCVG